MVKVALLVGVSQYKPGFQPLPSAIEDIQAMERVLREKGEFEVETLDNPERKAMESAIDKLFANRTSEDVVLFYFSGHGVKDYKRRFYLTTSETLKDKDRIIKHLTAVAASYLQWQMTDSRSERQVVILDCCYSGAFPDGMMVKGGAIDIQAELGGKGRAILTSSNAIQESYIQEGSKLSLYTHYLIEGIETGAADLDNNGSISVDELHEYTSKRVQEASPAMTPEFYPGEGGYKIYLARAPIDDPKLKYRQEAQKLAKQGEFSLISRRILDRFQIELGLEPGEGERIEVEVLEPYQEYKHAFQEMVEQEYPLSEDTRNELQRFQELLGLRDEDVQKIEKPIIDQKEAEARKREEIELIRQQQEAANQPKVTESEDGSRLQVFGFDVIKVNNKGQEVKREEGQAQYFTEDLGNGVTLDMVYIPGGEFIFSFVRRPSRLAQG